MSLPEKAFPVSWDQFHRDARALAWRLAGANGQWKAIVCITRGGLVPAAIISRELGVRIIETVSVASYHDYTTQGELAVIWLARLHDELLLDRPGRYWNGALSTVATLLVLTGAVIWWPGIATWRWTTAPA